MYVLFNQCVVGRGVLEEQSHTVTPRACFCFVLGIGIGKAA
jgi:hypothetical protein